VDGGEANDDAGGVRLTVSQDAVQEFQINRSNYSAELGGASGAALNIVTKSGANETHGTLHGFFSQRCHGCTESILVQPGVAAGQCVRSCRPRFSGTASQFGGVLQ
jgi:hypothetical protein